MTGKRFYYNTFYHADDMSRVLEYEIIDRQSYPNYPNYNEKKDIPKWYIYIGENDSGWQDMLVDLLNALHEENQELKSNYSEQCIQLDFLKDENQHMRDLVNENKQLKKENKELKKQLRREETDKKRLMSYLMRYKGFGFDEIVEDFLDEPYYDNWWEDGFYEFCWDEYLKEKCFDGCDVE